MRRGRDHRISTWIASRRSTTTSCDTAGDEYGKKTPLFVDGIQVSTKTPVVAANGDMICDFVFQQYLLRGLVGLSGVTGEQKYRRAACQATDYVPQEHGQCEVGIDLLGPPRVLGPEDGRPAVRPPQQS